MSYFIPSYFILFYFILIKFHMIFLLSFYFIWFYFHLYPPLFIADLILFYIIVLGLLIWTSFYGITSSGSQRWLNLYFINLQPSELMKIALIIFLARYYYKIPTQNVSHFKHIFIPLLSLVVPVFLVVAQPDLGTAVLIAISGIIVIWLSGFKIK